MVSHLALQVVGLTPVTIPIVGRFVLRQPQESGETSFANERTVIATRQRRRTFSISRGIVVRGLVFVLGYMGGHDLFGQIDFQVPFSTDVLGLQSRARKASQELHLPKEILARTPTNGSMLGVR